MESKRQLTREELLEMESAPKTKMQHMLDVVICFCPYFGSDNYVFSILSDAGCRSEF